MTATTFVDALGQLSQGELARIKQSGGEVIPPAVTLEIPEGADEEPYNIVSYLYTRYCLVLGGHGNIGALMRMLGQRIPRHDTERRLMDMLDRREVVDLRKPLEWATAMAAQNHLGVDWAQLLGDLVQWEEPERSVQRAWSRAFWGGRTDPDDDTEMTMAQAVTEFGLTPSYQQSLSRAAAAGTLPARRVGRAWVAQRSDIQEWLANRPGPGWRPGVPRGKTATE